MRLIDADALRAEFKRPTDWMDRDQALVHITGIWACIDNAPTVEPERKTGRWKSYYHTPSNFTYSCNCCGYGAPYYLIKSNTYIQKRWNFCPMCGAKMEDNE